MVSVLERVDCINFLVGLPRLFILPRTGLPVNVLVVWDKWTTDNFKHCLNNLSQVCTRCKI